MANPKILAGKQAVIDEIANNVKESSSFIFLDNKGLTVAETIELRRKLKESGSTLKTYKNTLITRALNDLNIKFKSKVAVVSQTTKKIENFMKIVDFLVKKVREVRVFNTICNATLENQEAAKELAERADIMIIIGGKNSSNTKQLFLISQKFCKDSYLIENENELEISWFENKNLCGISAGASTPDWIIQKVIAKISNFKF